MVLFVIVTVQSCAAGTANVMEGSNESSGSAGFFLAILMLVLGIIGVAGKKSKACSIVAGGLYAVGGLIGIANVGSFADLQIWSILSFCFAVFFILSGILQKSAKSAE